MYTRISPPFCFNIPNPDIQIRQIPHPEKPIGVPLSCPSLSLSCTIGESPENEVFGFFLAFYLLLFDSVIYFLTVSTVKNHWYLPNKKPALFLLQTAWSVNPFCHHTNQTPHLKNKKIASLTRANRSGRISVIYIVRPGSQRGRFSGYL